MPNGIYGAGTVKRFNLISTHRIRQQASSTVQSIRVK